MILDSACLVRLNCKYNVSNNFNEKVYELVREEKAILLCREQLGGLATPRLISKINTSIIKDIL